MTLGCALDQGRVCYDADFYPFGGERDVTVSCSQNYKFEGKERDSETQNDDFGARYYSWRVGRWLSADWSAVPAPVPYANLTNPQTLNLYAMVSDNPETFADLDGHGTNPVPPPPPQPTPPPPPPPPPPSWALDFPTHANTLSAHDIGNIVFNETRSFSDSKSENMSTDQMRDDVAHAVI